MNKQQILELVLGKNVHDADELAPRSGSPSIVRPNQIEQAEPRAYNGEWDMRNSERAYHGYDTE